MALFGSILVRRSIFHTTLYGEQVNVNSPAYHETLLRLQHHAAQTLGGTGAEAAARAGALLRSYVGRQGFVSAIDDVFLVVGGILAVSLVPIAFLRVHRKGRSAHSDEIPRGRTGPMPQPGVGRQAALAHQAGKERGGL